MSGAFKRKSKVDKKVQRLESEDNSSNNLSTSVRHDINHDDIVWTTHITNYESVELKDKEPLG